MPVRSRTCSKRRYLHCLPKPPGFRNFPKVSTCSAAWTNHLDRQAVEKLFGVGGAPRPVKRARTWS